MADSAAIQVAKTADILALAEKAGAKMRRAGHEWRGACPLHGGHNSTGFVIWDDSGSQRWHCFSGDCGGGDAIEFVKVWLNCEFPKAIEYLVGNRPYDRQEILKLAEERSQKRKIELERKQAEYEKSLHDLRTAQVWMAYHEQLEVNPQARELWRRRGIPDDFQNYFRLGYCPSFSALFEKKTPFTTPTLTIPVFAPGWEVLTVRHRLLRPIDPDDKYRPDRPGLQAAAFLCDPDAGWNAQNILIVEGEIKAAVTWLTLDSVDWQVVGIPGKRYFDQIKDNLTGKNTVFCLDPDAIEKSELYAWEVGGRVIRLAMKVDDAITSGALDKNGMKYLIKSAKKATR